ncbi:GNAT family N-acetyltransferase [Nonomuraea typhae]|uniref:GNAT family N-acetyltransferase n=1 Tax=Nonomuraea typhae TaxID=2603600 RepID=UPI0012F91768|nr:GNAT family N-acetyltransferase [Nonomuraea typhae]
MSQPALRVMELRDVPTVVHMHQADLAQGFFVELGRRFLNRYYRTYLTSPAAVALIAELGGEPAGFLVGCTDARVHRRHVVHLERWRLARAGAASLLRRPDLTARFVRTRAQRYARGFRHPAPEGTAGRAGVLNHVAVQRGLRRSKVGSALVAGFVEIARVHGVERLSLQTEAGNVAAHRFYANLGWKPQEPITDAEGKTWLPFALDL